MTVSEQEKNLDTSYAATTPVEHGGRRGFLPIETNWFDRLFIGVVSHVALNLLWMRFLEPQGAPLFIGTALGLIWIVVVMKWG
jgi:predicted small integral membrane protein